MVTCPPFKDSRVSKPYTKKTSKSTKFLKIKKIKSLHSGLLYCKAFGVFKD